MEATRSRMGGLARRVFRFPVFARFCPDARRLSSIVIRRNLSKRYKRLRNANRREKRKMLISQGMFREFVKHLTDCVCRVIHAFLFVSMPIHFVANDSVIVCIPVYGGPRSFRLRNVCYRVHRALEFM